MKNLILSFIFVITGLFTTFFAVAESEIVTKVIDDRQVSGRFHENGGGFVADTAHVDPTAYVGREALVTDNARVTDHATVTDTSEVYGNARVTDNALVYGNARRRFGYATVIQFFKNCKNALKKS